MVKDNINAKLLIFFLFHFTFLSCTDQSNIEEKYKMIFQKKRYDMVDRQIISRGIKNQNVIQAMQKVERHLFVPEGYQNEAYDDHPLPIGEGQTISQPYIVALMSEAIRPKKDDKILEIGTGSGYQAAVLAEICSEVYTIEIVEKLAKSSAKLLNKLTYTNVIVKSGDGFLGWKEHAPFDCIIVTAAPPEIPPPLLEQLAEGGRMIIPLGPNWRWQVLCYITKKNGKIFKKELANVSFVPMTGEGIKNFLKEK